jgi:hypothetical protein
MYKYVEDWDEKVRGAFPVKSRRYAEKKQVVLSGPKGTYAGWEIRPSQVIGKGDSEETLPPVYTAIALIEANEETQARAKAKQDEALARIVAGQQRRNAKAALESKRENGQPLTQKDMETLADLLLNRL